MSLQVLSNFSLTCDKKLKKTHLIWTCEWHEVSRVPSRLNFPILIIDVTLCDSTEHEIWRFMIHSVLFLDGSEEERNLIKFMWFILSNIHFYNSIFLDMLGPLTLIYDTTETISFINHSILDNRKIKISNSKPQSREGRKKWKRIYHLFVVRCGRENIFTILWNH